METEGLGIIELPYGSLPLTFIRVAKGMRRNIANRWRVKQGGLAREFQGLILSLLSVEIRALIHELPTVRSNATSHRFGRGFGCHRSSRLCTPILCHLLS